MRGPHATTPASEEPFPRVAFPSFTNPCNPPPLHDKCICNRSSGAQLSSSRRRSNASTSSYMTTTEAGSTEEVAFQVFPWIWLQLMQCVLDGLVDVPREPVHEAEHRALVAEVIDHHASYFLIKSILALRDPAFVLYPPWLSVLARALLWMGGWRPTAALRLVPAGILSAEQAWALEAIRQVARAEVAVVEEEMRRVQIEGVVGLMMAGRAAVAAVADAEKAAIERMLARQWTVTVVADSLRMKVLRRVVAVLSPLQAVDFLAAVVRMEISMHHM